MTYISLGKQRAEDAAELFRSVFAASEGVEEGALIGDLARRLLTDTPTADLHAFAAQDGSALLGVILFSRLVFDGDERSVFVMGPVAVASPAQGRGVGQALIRHGLATLAAAGVDVALTYGDPAYYSRVGFAPITEADVPAPFPLRFPEGWLGQSLTSARLTPITGPSRCVPAFDDPAFW